MRTGNVSLPPDELQAHQILFPGILDLSRLGTEGITGDFNQQTCRRCRLQGQTCIREYKVRFYRMNEKYGLTYSSRQTWVKISPKCTFLFNFYMILFDSINFDFDGRGSTPNKSI